MHLRYLVVSIALLMANMVQATLIPSGTKLYLDASQAWTSASYFSAYFWSNTTNGNYVAMTAVPGENRIYEVTAPGSGQVWTNVIFRCNNSASGTGTGWGSNIKYQTVDLVWDGNQSLYTITCDNCTKNADNTSVADGRWSAYIPVPLFDPTIAPYTDNNLCDTETGTTVTLSPATATDDYVNYQWFQYQNGTWSRIGNGELTPTVTLPANASDEVYYYFTGQRLFNGKITNGDFEAGNTGFTTDYTYVTPASSALLPEGVYTVTNSVRAVHPYAPATLTYDHTTGSGNMMAVNGGANVGIKIWEQTITGLTPNTQYAFTAWVMNWDTKNENLARLEFSINGELQGGQFSPSGGYGHWTQLYTIWNSGTNTSATIKLVNQQGATNGNDFAVDDIQFSELSNETSLLHYRFRDCSVPCPTYYLEQTHDTTVCDTLFHPTYTWRGHTFATAGTYSYMEYSQSGCDSVYHTLNLNTTHCEREPIEHPTQTICLGDPVTLTPTTVGDSYLWSDNSTGPTLTVTPSSVGETHYSCVVTIEGKPSLDKNIILNGGFEDVSASCPYNGFTSDYECHGVDEAFNYSKSYRGFYELSSQNWYGITPHSGSYCLVCDGDKNLKTAWSAYTTEGLIAGQQYCFSYWAAMQGTTYPAELTFYIEYNGKVDVLIPTVTLTNDLQWHQYGQDLAWTAPESCSQARVYLVDQCTSNNGNDFSIDDIIFQPLFGVDQEQRENFTVQTDDCTPPDPCAGFTTTTLYVDTVVCDTLLETAYTWRGHSFITKPDSFSVVIPSKIGCGDSIITWYRLDTVHCERPTPPVDPCAGFTTTTLYVDTVVCDTLLETAYTWRGHSFITKPDSFSVVIPSKIGCGDSIITWYRLDTVHCERPTPPTPPDPPTPTCLDGLVYQKWTNVLFCDNHEDLFVAFQWYQDNTAIAGATKQYLYLENGMGTATYYVEVTLTNGSKDQTCPITFGEAPRSADQDPPQQAQKFLQDGKLYIRFNGRVYNANGQVQ